MNARFYAPDANGPGLVSLPADEAAHLTRVLRLKAGDAVTVFNGRGAAFHAEVEAVGRQGVDIRVGPPAPAAREARVAITLVQAVLKGDKMDDVVRDAVMLGVAAIQPLLTTRSEVSRATLERGRRQERWERVAVSSAKQCGRAVVPPVHQPIDFAALSEAVRGTRLPGPVLMLVEPGASAHTVGMSALDAASPGEAAVVIGPEGGWTPDEIATAAAFCRLVTMGGPTIRADAMPVVAIAALFARWGEW